MEVAKENPVEHHVGFHSIVLDLNSAVYDEDIERPGDGLCLLAFHFSDLQHTKLMHMSGKWCSIFSFKNARDYVRWRDGGNKVTKSGWKTFCCVGSEYG